MDCLFCKIINKEIPSDIVYEDDFQIAVKNQFQNAKILTKEITQNI